VRTQLSNLVTKQNLKIVQCDPNNPSYYTNIKKCILEGFFMHTAHLEKGGHYMTLKDDQVVALHPSSVLDHKPEWVLYHEFVLTNKNYIRTVTEIEPEWLFEIAPEYFDLDEFRNSEAKRKLERAQRRVKDEQDD